MVKTVLIVDDNEDMIFVLEREFRRKSEYKICTSRTAQNAWTTLQLEQIDLIICDIHLGQESAFPFAQQVKQVYPKTGIVMMSGYHSAANKEHASALGIHSFIEKPFAIALLIEQVDSYFLLRELAQVQSQAAQPAVSTASAAPAGAQTLMAHFSVQDLVQLFCLNGRNVAISLSQNGNVVGVLYIQKGQIRHAYYETLTGDSAALALLKLPATQLFVAEAPEEVAQTVQSDWHHLLLLGAVEKDHTTQLPNLTDASPPPIARLA